ncbi:hypothetical protein GF412_05645 [Candidatus Micrarchaeota archaeon]|nr:hypothetical protein [Candidatus Micrarchaeota archaeon]
MNLNFSSQISRKLDTRNKPDKYAESLMRNIIRDLGEGDNLSDVFYPYKYLPVGMQDTTTEDFIVIPKGRAVSLLTHYDNTEASGILPPGSGQSIDIALSAIDSSHITTAIDDTYWGYPNHVAALLVPANGGAIYSGQYTSRDVTAETLRLGGGVVTTANTAGPVIQANYPVGVVIGDVYQDIRGKNLNYQLFDKAVAVKTNWYIEVPYVRIANGNEGTYTIDPSTAEIVGTSMTFDTMNSKYTYLRILDNDNYKAGVSVKPDTRGNYVIEGTTPTIQSVGKLVLTDCRYPKDMLELVDTYENSDMPGTDTGGIPTHLFQFAHDYLVATSASNRIYDVVEAIQAGTFGAARILINR